MLLESAASYQIVKVNDSGVGIIPEAIPYLFERFYQGACDRQTKGSDLGLFRQIVEAHDGYPIGAVFAFRFPPYRFNHPLVPDALSSITGSDRRR
ncbi:MAG: hypothetical protein KME16_09560 [Scytolyngbya sp. HA4215-MV1]|nr:hypothetical protein [Scytolyngbya sp. HA4215-MV1]